jgi:hypothetical protein
MDGEIALRPEEEGPEAKVGPQLSNRRLSSRLWIRHFRRPVERPFTAQKRDHVTILFGGPTWKHERFIQAARRAVIIFRLFRMPHCPATTRGIANKRGFPGIGDRSRNVRDVEHERRCVSLNQVLREVNARNVVFRASNLVISSRLLGRFQIPLDGHEDPLH